MKLCRYKITDAERQEAEELLRKYIPHVSSRIDYEEYFKEFLNIGQLTILCKYFACNIVELAKEARAYKGLTQGTGESCYAGPPESKTNAKKQTGKRDDKKEKSKTKGKKRKKKTNGKK